MNFVSRRPDDLVFSCLVFPDYEHAQLKLQLYLLQPDIGWKPITTFNYSNDSDFNELSPGERGQIGESLGIIFTKRFLYEDRFTIFPELKTGNILIEECVFARGSDRPIHSFNSWVPDATFQIFSNPDPVELSYEFNPKKFVYTEVKTGKSAKFERWQKEEMIQYNQLPNSIALFCEVLPNSSEHTIKMNVKRMSDGEWRTSKTYHYSDFQSSLIEASK